MTSLIPFSDIKKLLLKCRKTTHKKEFDELLLSFEKEEITSMQFIKQLGKYYYELNGIKNTVINDKNISSITDYNPSNIILATRFNFKDYVIFCFDDNEIKREEHNIRVLNRYYPTVRE